MGLGLERWRGCAGIDARNLQASIISYIYNNDMLQLIKNLMICNYVNKILTLLINKREKILKVKLIQKTKI